MAEVDAGASQDYPARTSKVVRTPSGLSILVCRTNEQFYAVENRCSHLDQELAGGAIKKCFLFCPVHGARFDLRDGSPSGTLTTKPLRIFPVREENGRVLVSVSCDVVP